MARGKFIVIEGSEGAGKTTITKMLADMLAQRDSGKVGPLTTREPGGCPLSEHIRGLILGADGQPRPYEMSPHVEVAMFLAARAAHIDQTIRPTLDLGRDVICDRWNWSTMAYQSFGGAIDCFGLANAIDFVVNLHPDLLIFLDTSPVVGQERVRKRLEAKGATGDHFERLGIDFHEKVQRGYEFCWQTQFSRPKTLFRIDANVPVAAYWPALKNFVDSWLNEDGRL